MRSYIQLTDTNNDIIRSLPLGDLSSTTTYSFRVWNNLPQSGGVAALDGLELNISYPPKQGIKTLMNEDIIQVRCTYSGKQSDTVTSSFQAFPIIDDDYNRLEPYCYNEYEVQIDFSGLSSEQKLSVDGVEMEFNVIATYDVEYVPLTKPMYRNITSDTYINWTGVQKITVTSDTLISGTVVIWSIQKLSDTNILGQYYIDSYSDSTVKGVFDIAVLADTTILAGGTSRISLLSDSKMIGVLHMDIESDSAILVTTEMTVTSDERVVGVNFGDVIEFYTDSRILNSTDATVTSDSWVNLITTIEKDANTRIKVEGQLPLRLQIESNTLIV